MIKMMTVATPNGLRKTYLSGLFMAAFEVLARGRKDGSERRSSQTRILVKLHPASYYIFLGGFTFEISYVLF